MGNNLVYGVYASGSTVYAATSGGLSISTDGGSSFTNKTTTNGLGANSVNGVYVSGSTVYAATGVGGLSISTDGGASFTNYTTTNGLGSNIVYGVYATDSKIYAATSGGLSFCSAAAACTPTSSTDTVSACVSYTWNGNTYTSTGTYTWTGTNAAGCDSVATLNLTIAPSTSTNTTAAACDSYIWSVNGQTYTQSGSYTSVVGCTTENLSLTITPSTTNTTTQTAAGTYTWPVNGQTYTQSGTYISVIGCATEILNLTITGGGCTQTTQPSIACYETASWNTTTCQWDVTGTQPSAPTGLAGWQTATFNTTTCQWDVTGTPPGAPVAGTVVYANAASMPMVNAVVVLKQGSNEVHRDTTDATGAFSLSAVVAGSYDVVVTPNTAWGGVNATDAVTILRSFSGAAPLSGLRLAVADVNGSSSVNSTDALNALNRFTGALTSYNVGDYAADATSYAVTGSGAGTLNVSMLCYGDVNGSYQPTGGFVRTTWRSLDQQGVLRVGTSGSYEVPLYASRQVQPGAVSLELALPEGVRLLGVRASEALDAQQVVYHQQGNRVRIAWIDESGAELRTGEALAYLMVEGDARGVWRWSSEVELANVLGEVQAGVELRMPKLTQGFEALAVSIYPNPGQGMRTLELSLGESMRVVVRVTDALGRVVYAREGLQYGTGTHKLELNMEGWPAGSYQVQVLGETAEGSVQNIHSTVLQGR